MDGRMDGHTYEHTHTHTLSLSLFNTHPQAYVDQSSDLHSPYMTAGEVLHFSAELRLSRRVRA